MVKTIKEIIKAVNKITPNGLLALMVLLSFMLSSVLGYIVIKLF